MRRVGNFVLDRHEWGIIDLLTNKAVELTRLEYRLLDVLMRNPHQAVARDVLYQLVWNRAQGCKPTNCLDVMIAYLRRKLGRAAIRTERGRGYRFAG